MNNSVNGGFGGRQNKDEISSHEDQQIGGGGGILAPSSY